MKFFRLFILCIALLSLSIPARADCVNPTAEEGAQIYNSTYKTMQFCDGTLWWGMKGGGGAGGSVGFDECQDGETPVYSVANNRFECPFDHTPDAFSFTDETDVELSTLTESDIVQVTSIDDDTDISITGDGSPEYRICDDATCSTTPAYTAAAGTIDNGDYLQLRLTSSAAFETANSATLSIGEASDQWDVTTELEIRASCKEYSDAGVTADGVYQVDPDGGGAEPAINAYCDMATDGGGWTLVMNYLHAGGTNSSPDTKTTALPLIDSSTLGTNESGSPTNWGHAANSLMNKLTFSEVRFYCKTSLHSRVVHFKTPLPGCVSYLKTGTGNCYNTLSSNFTALTGHTAVIPATNNGGYADRGDGAMLDFTIYQSPTNHWGIFTSLSRWECDDYANSAAYHTLHRVWIR